MTNRMSRRVEAVRRAAQVVLIAVLAAVVCLGRAGGQAVAAGPGSSLDIWAGIREIGFPAAAFVLLWVMMGRQLRDNTRALQELAGAIREVRGVIVGCGRNRTDREESRE